MTQNNLEFLTQAWKKVNGANFKCFVRDCRKQAIDSHSQSKARAVDMIAENNHVIRFDPHFFNKSVEDLFVVVGVKQASVFKGFCSHHDNLLFQEIDKVSDAILTKENLVKLSFRTFAYEVRAKERMAYFYEMMLHNFKSELAGSEMEAQSEGVKNNLDVTAPYYLNLFTNWIQNQQWNEISTIIYKVPFIPVTTSTMTEPTSLSVLDQTEGNIDLSQPLESVFFNLIPGKGRSLAIFSFLKGNEDRIQKFINDYPNLESIIFNNCEEILMRPSFYKSIDESTKQKMILALQPWTSWEKVRVGLLNIQLQHPELI